MEENVKLVLDLKGDIIERLTDLDKNLAIIYKDMHKIDKIGDKAFKIRGLEESRREAERMSKSTFSTSKSLDSLNNQLRRLETGAARAWRTDHIERYRKMIDATKKEIASTQKLHGGSLEQPSARGGATPLPFGKIGLIGAATMAGGVAIGMGKQAFETRAKYEKFEAVLQNTLGSRSMGMQAMDDIQGFAATTPYQVDELTDAYVKLVNRGFKPSMLQMRAMGDIAASTGKGFDQLVEAMMDAETGEFERLKEFGIKAKQNGDKVTLTFKGQSKTIANTSESIRSYVLSLGAAAGVQGSMGAISKTLGGQLSNLQDNWDGLMNAVGKSSSGMFSGGMSLLNQALSEIKNLVEESPVELVMREKAEVNSLVGSIVNLNEGNETRLQLLQKLKEQYPELLSSIDMEKVKNTELLGIVGKVNAAYSTGFKLAVRKDMLQKEQAKLDELMDKQQKIEQYKQLGRMAAHFGNKMARGEALSYTEREEYQAIQRAMTPLGREVGFSAGGEGFDSDISRQKAVVAELKNKTEKARREDIINRAMAVNVNDPAVMQNMFKGNARTKKLFQFQTGRDKQYWTNADYDKVEQILQGTYGSGTATATAASEKVKEMSTDISTGGKSVKQITINMEALVKDVTNNFTRDMGVSEATGFMDKLQEALVMVLNESQQAI